MTVEELEHLLATLPPTAVVTELTILVTLKDQTHAD